MEKSRMPRKDYLRIAHEFLFSLNLGLVVRLAMAYANYYHTEGTLKFWLNRQLHLDPHSDVGGNAAFLLLALEITLSIFLLLRIFSQISLIRMFLLYAAGIVSAVALPFSWLYGAHLYEPPPGLPNPPHGLLFLELVAVTVCAILYLLAKWPLPGWGGILLLILHYGFWGWLFLGGPYFWLGPFKLLFPLAGLCSAVAWALYVSDRADWMTASAPSTK